MRTTKHLTLIFWICLSAFAVKAQKKINEGSISYTATYNLDAENQMAAAMLPKEYKIFFKGDLSKFTMDLGMMTNEVFSDAKNNTGLMLMNVPMANQKIAVKITPAEKAKQQEITSNFEITKTSETKTIGAYKAVKYNAKDKNSDSSAEVWVTNDILLPVNNFTEGFKGVTGTPLAFSTTMNGISINLNLKEIKEESVGNLEMKIPEGYTEKTMDELMSMSGK